MQIKLNFILYFIVHPLIQVPNQLVGAPPNTDVTLICNVEASPKSINYWQRENGLNNFFFVFLLFFCWSRNYILMY